MKKFTFLFALTLLLSIGIAGCESNSEKFIGTWHRTNDPEHFLIIEHLSGNDYSVTEKKDGKVSDFDPLGWGWQSIF